MENAEKCSKDIKIVADVEYWTSKKAATYLGISKQALYVYARQNRVSKLNFGGFVFFKREWLDDFINEMTTIGVATRKKTITKWQSQRTA